MAENLGISCPILYPSDLNSLASPQVWPGYNVYGGGADIFLDAPPPGSGNPVSPTSAACGPGSSLSGNWVTTSDDYLKVSAWSSVNPTLIRFYGRHRDPTGELRPFLHDVTATSSSTAVSTTTGVYQGCLTNIHASAPNGVGSATVYVLAQLGKIRGGVFLPHTEVLSGVLTDKGLLSGVSDPNAGGGGGGGGGCCIGDFAVYEPANAVLVSQIVSVSAGTRSRLVNAGFLIQTDANAATRYVSVLAYPTSSGLNRVDATDQFGQTASLSVNYVAALQLTQLVVPAATGLIRHQIDLGEGQWFDSEFEIDLALTNPQAGDLIKFPFLWVETVTI